MVNRPDSGGGRSRREAKQRHQHVWEGQTVLTNVSARAWGASPGPRTESRETRRAVTYFPAA